MFTLFVVNHTVNANVLSVYFFMALFAYAVFESPTPPRVRASLLHLMYFRRMTHAVGVLARQYSLHQPGYFREILFPIYLLLCIPHSRRNRV